MKKLSIKLLTVLMSLIVTVMSLPMNVFAYELQNAINSSNSNTDDATVTSDELETEEKSKSIVELVDLRTNDSKTFRLTDGSYYLAQYSTDVHSLDGEGRWQDIDNTLSVSGSEISTSDAKIKFAKKTNGSEKLFALHDGNRKLTLSIIGAAKGVPGQIKNGEDTLHENATELQKMTTLSNISASVIYEDILPNTDIEYIINGSNIKENIIVKARQNSYTYSFELSLNNLTAVLAADGDIIILDPATNENVYTIPAPVMWDASGETSCDAAFSLVDNGNGKYTLTVTADSEWMNAEERVFPITVDPAVFSQSWQSSDDITVDTTNSTEKCPGDTILSVNNNEASYWVLYQLPVIPSSAYIVGSYIYLKGFLNAETINSDQEYPNGYVGAYEVTSQWTAEKGNWDVSDGQLSQEYVDFQHVYSYLYREDGREDYYTVISNSGIFYWNITSIVKKWYTNSDYNYGIALAPIDGTEFKGTATFYSDNATSNIPRLIVQYMDMKGIEDYWTYSEQSAGNAGVGAVNNATGNLVFSIPTLTTTNALMPCTPSLVYNSSFAIEGNENSAFYGDETPAGFKWNIAETISKESIEGLYGSEDVYIWTDGDMTEHYFYEDLLNNGYKDEDGLLLTITTGENNTLVMTDINDNVKTFSNETGEDVWSLMSVSDKHGNKLLFNPASTQDPAEVTLITNNEDYASYTYQLEIYYCVSSIPYAILNPQSKEAIIFRYSELYNGNIVTDKEKYLRQIIKVYGLDNSYDCLMFYQNTLDEINVPYTSVTLANYEYNSDGTLRVAEDKVSNYRLTYTYTNGKVSSVVESAKNAQGTYIQGQKIKFTYNTSSTIVLTTGRDDKIYNVSTDTYNDDLYTTFVFDNMGRTINHKYMGLPIDSLSVQIMKMRLIV